MIKPGTIFSTRWNDYYQVERSTERTVWVRRLRTRTVERVNRQTDVVEPVPGDFADDEVLRRRPAYGSIRIAPGAIAFPWDGDAGLTNWDV